jgi:predicted RNase H-like HicB family nuclease
VRRRAVSAASDVYTVRIHNEPGHELWAEVAELPGCFASGKGMDELREALAEAISLYLSEPGRTVHVVQVELEDAPGSVTEQRALARTA